MIDQPVTLVKELFNMGVELLARGNAWEDDHLAEVQRKIKRGERLGFEDALLCLSTNDLASLGRMANGVKKAIHGRAVTFIRNYHINYTNLCENRCRFCAFHRPPGSEDGFVLMREELAKKIMESPVEPLREVHLVGGCNPDLDFEYHLDLLRTIKAVRPEVHIKAYTAVEVDHMSRRAGISPEECLLLLKDAGLEVMPGGGAEVFSPRLRYMLFPSKIDSKRWLEIHGIAHTLGIPTNATLLFGHLETKEEIASHLLQLRHQQDLSGGFQSFIPLPFQSKNTPLVPVAGPTGVEILKLIATARLVLDNFKSIKAYWVMLGPRLAQVALHFGADDLEGTIVHENIAHEAGASTARGMTVEELTGLIQEAGLEPVERDSFHRHLGC